MMKKIIKLLFIFFIVIGITACANEEEDKTLSIKWGKENKFDGLISYELESISSPQQITPDSLGTVYTFYKPQKDSNVLLDAVVSVKNLKTSDLKIDKDLSASFMIGEDEYIASVATVSEDGSSLKDNGVIASEAISKVHFYAEISPKKLKDEIEFKLTTKDEENPQTAALKFKLEDVSKNYEVKNMNDAITIENRSEIILQSTNVTKELAPANPSGLYTFYKVNEDTDSFVVLTTSIKNISGGDLTAGSVAAAKLVDKDGNEYPASIFCENEARSYLTTGNETVIGADQSIMVHFAFEMPDEIINNEKMVRISYQGKVFIVNI